MLPVPLPMTSMLLMTHSILTVIANSNMAMPEAITTGPPTPCNGTRSSARIVGPRSTATVCVAGVFAICSLSTSATASLRTCFTTTSWTLPTTKIGRKSAKKAVGSAALPFLAWSIKCARMLATPTTMHRYRWWPRLIATSTTATMTCTATICTTTTSTTCIRTRRDILEASTTLRALTLRVSCTTRTMITGTMTRATSAVV
mmetsp:Transcript_874/g.1681  ORF Transcript_874/g.1681 Transcript_874/m.1681 type:complete len:202 (+) Transcript_874:775-1380(+)